ncbi:hypothetical protein [Corallococcus sicarius]|uniref:hypothetical protein n=1 Tax=Corallococcus sicarius TaxID=2316726 RepID=UPI003F6E1742
MPDGTKTLSGWSEKPGYTQTTEGVLELSDAMKFPLRANKLLDQGVPGRYAASHAEPQMSVARPNEPIGVSKEMCTSCQAYFKVLASQRNATQVVEDPAVVRIFMPNGSVVVLPKPTLP